MKIVSTLGTTKADKATKLHNLLGADKRHVRHEGITYFIRIAKVGSLLLANAERKVGDPDINLFGKDKLAQELRKLCENRLYS